jgi:hypothetical protein
MQQIPFINLFIDLFKSALHVSGNKLAHLQEHFLTVYTAFCTMHRYCCRSVTTGRQQYRYIVPKVVYTVKKCSWRWASLSPETCRADSNGWIKRSINENCCILLVAYIVILMMHGLTNVKFSSRPLVTCWPGHRFDIFITDLLVSWFFPRPI